MALQRTFEVTLVIFPQIKVDIPSTVISGLPSWPLVRLYTISAKEYSFEGIKN